MSSKNMIFGEVKRLWMLRVLLVLFTFHFYRSAQAAPSAATDEGGSGQEEQSVVGNDASCADFVPHSPRHP